LAARGREVLDEIEDVRTWSLSCVLRAPTNVGPAYFKVGVDLPLFADEPRLARRLGELFPGHVPEVIAIDGERGWMLTADAGLAIGWDTPQEEWVAPFARCARMQRAAVDHVDGLLAAGCLDRDIQGLPAQLAALLDDVDTLGVLPDGMATAVADLRPRVAEACYRLQVCAIPATLVHGDLDVRNMATRNGSAVVFDWAEACVSHPFMDGLLPRHMSDPHARERTREAILNAWLEYASLPRLREAWALAELVCPAHHLVSYGSILANAPAPLVRELGVGLTNRAQLLLDAGAGASS
jgi:hypothetical protein